MIGFDFTKVNDLKSLFWYAVFFNADDYDTKQNLFHYTNASNKDKIIRETCIDFRLTRADSFEDIEEGFHIIRLYTNLVENLTANKVIDKDYADLLLSVVKSFSQISEGLRKEYICCFSQNEYSEYMWQNYACRNGVPGIVIGIDALDIEGLTTTNEGQATSAILVDVIYDENALARHMENVICQVYRLKKQDDAQMSYTKKIALSQLTLNSLIYKPYEYRHEEETRLIVDHKSLDLPDKRFYKDRDEKYIHMLLNERTLCGIREVFL